MKLIKSSKFNVAILYICTGRYFDFFDEFFKSMELYFLKDYQKEYFVFTNQEFIPISKRIHVIKQEQLGWPFDTLFRFHMFYSIKDKLCNFDYIIFMNANLLAVRPITLDFFSLEKDYLAVVHPLYLDISIENLNYERRESSRAYMSPNCGRHYFMGGLNGGKSKAFLEMTETLAENIELDINDNIVAVWHDESHINRYFWDNNEKLLIMNNYTVLYEEQITVDHSPFFTLINKEHKGGYSYFRKEL